MAYLQADRNNKDKEAQHLHPISMPRKSLPHLLLFMLSPGWYMEIPPKSRGHICSCQEVQRQLVYPCVWWEKMKNYNEYWKIIINMVAAAVLLPLNWYHEIMPLIFIALPEHMMFLLLDMCVPPRSRVLGLFLSYCHRLHMWSVAVIAIWIQFAVRGGMGAYSVRVAYRLRSTYTRERELSWKPDTRDSGTSY